MFYDNTSVALRIDVLFFSIKYQVIYTSSFISLIQNVQNQNVYTKRILEEWFQITPKSQYKLWINEEFSLVPDLHYDGSLVSTEEKCNIRIETIKELNSTNQQDDPVASKVRLLFKVNPN